MRILLIVFLTVIAAEFTYAQDGNGRLNIFIDCQMRCDFTYIRQEIDFVNFMQDRYQSDVYILTTRQRTGSGGDEIQLVFTGNNIYSAFSDTLLYNLSPDATEAIERADFVKNVKNFDTRTKIQLIHL